MIKCRVCEEKATVFIIGKLPNTTLAHFWVCEIHALAYNVGGESISKYFQEISEEEAVCHEVMKS
jgi:hypothetical protein